MPMTNRFMALPVMSLAGFFFYICMTNRYMEDFIWPGFCTQSLRHSPRAVGGSRLISSPEGHLGGIGRQRCRPAMVYYANFNGRGYL